MFDCNNYEYVDQENISGGCLSLYRTTWQLYVANWVYQYTVYRRVPLWQPTERCLLYCKLAIRKWSAARSEGRIKSIQQRRKQCSKKQRWSFPLFLVKYSTVMQTGYGSSMLTQCHWQFSLSFELVFYISLHARFPLT